MRRQARNPERAPAAAGSRPPPGSAAGPPRPGRGASGDVFEALRPVPGAARQATSSRRSGSARARAVAMRSASVRSDSSAAMRSSSSVNSGRIACLRKGLLTSSGSSAAFPRVDDLAEKDGLGGPGEPVAAARAAAALQDPRAHEALKIMLEKAAGHALQPRETALGKGAPFACVLGDPQQGIENEKQSAIADPHGSPRAPPWHPSTDRPARGPPPHRSPDRLMTEKRRAGRINSSSRFRERGGSPSPPQARADGPGPVSRGPKRAVPMRSMSAPMAAAIS